jgi:hypothetical protein
MKRCVLSKEPGRDELLLIRIWTPAYLQSRSRLSDEQELIPTGRGARTASEV